MSDMRIHKDIEANVYLNLISLTSNIFFSTKTVLRFRYFSNINGVFFSTEKMSPSYKVH